MRLLCFDPGETTGIAKFVNNELVWWRDTELWYGIEELIQFGDQVVYEGVFWHGPHFNPIGLKVIGVIEYLCKKNGCGVFPQSSGSIVGIKKWPIYDFTSIKSQHSIDAICHGIYRIGPNKVILPKNFITEEA